jgi:hypothetical protein
MHGFGIATKCVEVLLSFAIFELTYLSLCETKPTAEKLLIERLTEKSKMMRMVAVSLKHLPDVLTFEGYPELVSLEKLVFELRRMGELVALLPVTLAAQTRRVVGREHRPAARAAAGTTYRRLAHAHVLIPWPVTYLQGSA